MKTSLLEFEIQQGDSICCFSIHSIHSSKAKRLKQTSSLTEMLELICYDPETSKFIPGKDFQLLPTTQINEIKEKVLFICTREVELPKIVTEVISRQVYFNHEPLDINVCLQFNHHLTITDHLVESFIFYLIQFNVNITLTLKSELLLQISFNRHVKRQEKKHHSQHHHHHSTDKLPIKIIIKEQAAQSNVLKIFFDRILSLVIGSEIKFTNGIISSQFQDYVLNLFTKFRVLQTTFRMTYYPFLQYAINLESLAFNHGSSNLVKNFFRDKLSQITNLKKLELINIGYLDRDQLEDFKYFLICRGSKLTLLSLSIKYCPNLIETISKYCTSLQFLKLQLDKQTCLLESIVPFIPRIKSLEKLVCHQLNKHHIQLITKTHKKYCKQFKEESKLTINDHEF